MSMTQDRPKSAMVNANADVTYFVIGCILSTEVDEGKVQASTWRGALGNYADYVEVVPATVDARSFKF